MNSVSPSGHRPVLRLLLGLEEMSLVSLVPADAWASSSARGEMCQLAVTVQTDRDQLCSQSLEISLMAPTRTRLTSILQLLSPPDFTVLGLKTSLNLDLFFRSELVTGTKILEFRWTEQVTETLLLLRWSFCMLGKVWRESLQRRTCERERNFTLMNHPKK